MSTGQTQIECRCGTVIPIPYTFEDSPVHRVGERLVILRPDYGPMEAHIATHNGGPGHGLRVAS